MTGGTNLVLSAEDTMAHQSQAKFAESVRRAKARLSNMNTQEVSLVDNAANKRRFVIVKRDQEMSDKKVTKDALRLPSEAKQGIMDGVAQALDKLTALATMVGEAETDDTATVPSDLGLALKQVGELIGGLGDQYAPADAPPAEGEPAPDATAAPPPPEMTEEGKAAEPAKDPTEKALPPPQKEGDNLTPMRDGDKMDPPQKKMLETIGVAFEAATKLLSDEISETAKAGRKIKGSRYQKLTELHGALGKLLNELAFDDASAEAEEKAAKSPAKKADAAPVAKSDDSSKLDKLLELAASNAAKLKEHDAVIAKMARTPAESRVQEVEGNGAPSKVIWPLDMSADLAARKKAAAKS